VRYKSTFNNSCDYSVQLGYEKGTLDATNFFQTRLELLAHQAEEIYFANDDYSNCYNDYSQNYK